MAKFVFQEQVQRSSLTAHKVSIVLLRPQMKQCLTILATKDSSVRLQQVKLQRRETTVLKLTIALREQVNIITLKTLLTMTIGELMLRHDVREALVMITVTLKCSCSSA